MARHSFNRSIFGIPDILKGYGKNNLSEEIKNQREAQELKNDIYSEETESPSKHSTDDPANSLEFLDSSEDKKNRIPGNHGDSVNKTARSPGKKSLPYKVGDYIMDHNGDIGVITQNMGDLGEPGNYFWEWQRINHEFVLDDNVGMNEIHSKIKKSEYDKLLRLGGEDDMKYELYLSHLTEKYGLTEIDYVARDLSDKELKGLIDSASAGWDTFRNVWTKYNNKRGYDVDELNGVFDALTDYEKQELLNAVMTGNRNIFGELLSDYFKRYDPFAEEEVEFDFSELGGILQEFEGDEEDENLEDDDEDYLTAIKTARQPMAEDDSDMTQNDENGNLSNAEPTLDPHQMSGNTPGRYDQDTAKNPSHHERTENSKGSQIS